MTGNSPLIGSRGGSRHSPKRISSGGNLGMIELFIGFHGIVPFFEATPYRAHFWQGSKFITGSRFLTAFIAIGIGQGQTAIATRLS